jgi:RNA polymerase sigma factor (TIGR02999 family)
VSADPLPPDGSFAAVYDELRRLAAAKLAGEPAGHTLDATALVHEAYLRLGGATGFETKSRFVRAAAEAMRRILVDHARKKRAGKRGGNAKRHELAGVEQAAAADPDTVIAIDEALEKLATVDEAAGVLGVSRATAFRDWAYAQAWLTAALAET